VSSDHLRTFLNAARLAVDAALERSLPSPPACPAIVSDAMRYSVFAGGKRLRPILTLAAADAVVRRSPAASAPVELRRASPTLAMSPGERRRDVPRAMPSTAHDLDAGEGLSPAIAIALPAACAIEMIHTYSLIHDDLPAMDNDTLRRGRPTLHVLYGDGIAILAGDGLQAAAFSLLAAEPTGEDPALPAYKLRVIRAIGDAAGPTGMVGGQAIDLQAGGRAPDHGVTLDAERLRAMHARKTGALIRASAVCGAIMAGGDAATLAAIDRYARDVGLAFQIIDDILDVEGDAASLGKTTGKDAAGAKPTYPALYGLDGSRTLARDCLARAQQALADARLTDGWLAAIAEWVVTRKN
jgi:geranylgeranyl pyrophosphate synthase